ncbi:hypothetical protein QC761_200245 [Podospora bellae-mahoneyi]|uniref:Uncharacterized protein n=1 Tax=Podospora bellae-mahoneyi TaxID=2093777 RepID=A0ABR0FQ93_9PEZI|nr:hypothetical protein QC761_200245 [Podospora bellae-mahoneyi]
MLSTQEHQIPLPTLCPCCLAAISPPDLTTNLPSLHTMTTDQQSTTTNSIPSQSPAMVPSSLTTPQEQSALAALHGLTPEQELILREKVTPSSVMFALELARESEEGAIEPTVAKLLTDAFNKIWNKVVTRPNLYLMSEQEFAVFNYFQSFWPDKEIARKAVARFWDNPWAFATPAGQRRS